jgi:hypothetical protein
MTSNAPVEVGELRQLTTRHYARAVDGRDAEVARHLERLGSGM